MKKILILQLFLFIMIACTISLPGSEDAFEEKTSTQVALARTETALSHDVGMLTQETISAETQASDSIEPTNTVQAPDDPKTDLGQSTWTDDLSSGQYWSLESGSVQIDTTTFSLSNGKLSATASTTGKGNNWWLTYLTLQDAYLEAVFETKTCSGDDQYGLVFRAPDYVSGIAYYFHVTCNGHYDLRRWTNSGSTMLLGMPSDEKINKGANQTNILGVWAKGPVIRLYINNQLLEEISDSSLQNTGHFGIFINARQTPGLTVNLDEISYWTLN